MGTNGIAPKTYSARMRVLNGEVTPLVVNTGDSGEAQVEVPGFGVLLVAQTISAELISRIGPPQWRALLVQPDEDGNFSPKSRHIRLKAKAVNTHLEIELLHKAERLTVVLMIKGEDGIVDVTESMFSDETIEQGDKDE